MNRGCRDFVPLVSIDRLKKGFVNDQDVVQEFPDVFLDELPGLSHEREIEFSIELALGTTPNSKSPYWMEHIELEEMKKQQEELLDKGFI